MAQPTVTNYTRFVFDEIRTIGRAWFDMNPQEFMKDASEEDQQFLFEKVGEMAWRRLCDEKSMEQILREIGVDPADYLPPPNPNQARRGVVRLDGRAVRDDDGLHHYLGITFFWALYGWKFERDRMLQNLDWIASRGFDYARILGEVDWQGREIDPMWPDYEEVLAQTADAMYERGIRAQLSIVGGVQPDHVDLTEKVGRVVASRPEKFVYLEAANEYYRSDKLTEAQLIWMVSRLKELVPNLLALSAPKPGIVGELERWAKLSAMVGAQVLPFHTDRNESDAHWRQVRQAYDFHLAQGTGSDQEGPGSQSSGGQLEDPRQQAIKRFLAHGAGAGFYTWHAGAGVQGVAIPSLGRPANLWETPNADAIVGALHVVEAHMPEGFQNWSIRNNGRSNHPLQLNPAEWPESKDKTAGFWQGESAAFGRVNKNYAMLGPNNEFRETVCGMNAPADGELWPAGRALGTMELQMFDPVGVALEAKIKAGEELHLPGRPDKQAGYIIVGRYL